MSNPGDSAPLRRRLRLRAELRQTGRDFAALGAFFWTVVVPAKAKRAVAAWWLRRGEFCFTCDRRTWLTHDHHDVHPNLPASEVHR